MLWWCSCLHPHTQFALECGIAWFNVICVFFGSAAFTSHVWCYSTEFMQSDFTKARRTEPFMHFISTHKTRNCPLVQTNAPLAVLCTCYLAHQPSSTFCQVHLSASPTLKFALRFGHYEVALDMRRAIGSYEFQNIRFAELPKFIMSCKRSDELILFKCFFLCSVHDNLLKGQNATVFTGVQNIVSCVFANFLSSVIHRKVIQFQIRKPLKHTPSTLT